MATFDVFVEGPIDSTSQGVQRLAAAMAKRYGLAEADLAQRIAGGRFRVKANLDQPTAVKYARDLESIGARASVREVAAAGGRTKSTTERPPAAPPRDLARTEVPSRALSKSSPPENARGAERSSRSSLAPSAPPQTTNPPPSYRSGLAAAFTPAAGVETVGALDALDSGDLMLATLDGSDSPHEVSGTFAPPDEPLPASIGPKLAAVSPAPPPPKAAQPTPPPVSPGDGLSDMFAPPAAGDPVVELAIDDDRPRRKAKTPPAGAAAAAAQAPAAATPVLHKPTRSRPATPEPPAIVATSSHAARARFAAGVLGAVLVGFVPAHIVASVREGVYDDIDSKITEVQERVGDVDAPIAYAQLDAFRDDQLATKKRHRRNIALLGLVVWAVAGGAAGYVWFKRLRPNH